MMIMVHVHRGECKAGATLPVLHIVGDSVSAREVLKIRRRLNIASTHNQQKQYMGRVPMQQQELSFRSMLQQDDSKTETHTLARHEHVNNATSGFSSALARAFIVASEPAMMMKARSQMPTRRNYAAIDDLDLSCYGQDNGNFFSKLAESHHTPCNKFAENYKGEDYDSIFSCTREGSTDFTRGISADVACLENFQEFSCLTWTEEDFAMVYSNFDACESSKSTVTYDTFLESSAGLMPARKKARIN